MTNRFDRHSFHQALTFYQTQAGLDPIAVDLHWLETTDSTNRQLWQHLDRPADLAKTPTKTPVVIAAQQTQGKGQYGRQWQSGLGGLYFSMPIAPQPAAQMTLTTVAALADLLHRQGLPVKIKWLNDLVLGGKKLGGILTEARWGGGQMVGAIVGIGLNISNATPESGTSITAFLNQSDRDKTPQNLTDLHDFFEKIPGEESAALEKVAGLCVAAVQLGQHRLTNLSPDVLRDSYETHMAHLHQSVQINGRQGTIVGVSGNGNLRVRFTSGLTSMDRDLTSICEEEIYLEPGTIALGYG
jgi:BirA family transcriptional regulator, biotin operon repressor / biotin---[acetyl-CoA-carboxylase] ligase